MASLSESESEPFLSQVERVRKEIRDKFSKSHQTLNEREAALLSQLDQLVASYKGEEVREQIQQLSNSKESVMSALKGNENYEALELSIAPLNTRIRELELSLESTETRMSRVELEWDGTLEERLSEIGKIRIIGLLDYKKKGEPVLIAGKHSHARSTEVGVSSILNQSQSILKQIIFTFAIKETIAYRSSLVHSSFFFSLMRR